MVGVLSGCAGRQPVPPAAAADVPASTGEHRAPAPVAADARHWPDVNSHADPQAFVTRHLDLSLEVDFKCRCLRGAATLELDRIDPEATELVLDTRDLAVGSVRVAATDGGPFTPTAYTLGRRDDVLGSPLRIAVPRGTGRVRIDYATSPDASGLQWLEPAQTAGKRRPFLFSQAQALHARSFVPSQDTPRIRATYQATLRVPAGFVAAMAAEADPRNRRGGTEFRFRMPQPVPSYLIALAVGDLEFRATGVRTGVWAEPSMLEAAAREFADAEAMLVTTEAMYGPYRWGRYDVLVLPPSFPYGGMENPRLTFMTPTVVVGDRSLVNVLAHELAHSWSGNLVTNATWRDVWLNEGFTNYFERRIVEAVYGRERAAMEWGVGMQEMQRSLEALRPEEAWRAELAPDLATHPGETGSVVANDKGALFLYQLERIYGRDRLDAFLHGWFERHAFTSVTTPQFVAELQRELLDRLPGRIDAGFLRRWIDEPGVPADALQVASDAFAKVDAQREAWQRGDLPTAGLETTQWSVQEWLHFVDHVSRPQPLARLVELDRRFGLTDSPNAEVAHVWFRLALASGYRDVDAALERYLMRIGRIKLIRPLYADLMRSPAGAGLARRVYAQARPGYHPIAQQALDRVVK